MFLDGWRHPYPRHPAVHHGHQATAAKLGGVAAHMVAPTLLDGRVRHHRRGVVLAVVALVGKGLAEEAGRSGLATFAAPANATETPGGRMHYGAARSRQCKPAWSRTPAPSGGWRSMTTRR